MTTLAQDAAPGHAKKVDIFIDDTKYQVTDPTMTGRELKALAGIADANQIFLEVHGHGDDEQILDDATIDLKSGMKFYDIPIGNLGAR